MATTLTPRAAAWRPVAARLKLQRATQASPAAASAAQRAPRPSRGTAGRGAKRTVTRASPLAPPPPPPAARPPPPQQPPPTQRADQLRGLGYLLVVALLYGSYSPALRIVFSMPGPPTPAALTAASGVVELAVLLAALALAGSRGAAADASPEAGAAADASPLPLGLPAAAMAGLEIGLYNCAASFAQITGLSLTTATRGAFLVQASTLFTPLLSAAVGIPPSRPAWLGTVAAFAGTLIIALDRSGGAGGGDAAATLAPSALGDALILGAAVAYSAATVRMPAWVVRRRVQPLELALGKAAVLAAAGLAVVAAQAAELSAAGQPVAQLWPGWQDPAAWAVVLWAALGPGALASVLAGKGQRLVSPTTAQICFAAVPVASSLLAAALLPGEAVGPATLAGGAVVAAAGLVATLPEPSEPAEKRAEQ